MLPKGSGLIALARAHVLFPRRFTRRQTRYGFTMAGNTCDLIQRYIYVFGVWEPSISRWVAEFLKPGDVVIDVGANVGYVTLLAASRVGKGGRVYAFEPVPSIVKELRRNIELNDYSNIEVIPKIATDKPGKAVVFRSSDENTGMSSTVTHPGWTPEATVETVRVADAIDSAIWPAVRLVKIDTEGDELKVLGGIGEVLEAMPKGGAVLVEITPHLLALRGDSGSEVVDLLKDHGFRGYIIPNSYDPRSYVAPATPELRPFVGPVSEAVDMVFIKG